MITPITIHPLFMRSKRMTKTEPCRYCGGDCPNQPDYMCDGYYLHVLYPGDIDDLYKNEDD